MKYKAIKVPLQDYYEFCIATAVSVLSKQLDFVLRHRRWESAGSGEKVGRNWHGNRDLARKAHWIMHKMGDLRGKVR